MDWTLAMYGATYGILATHDSGKCPSVTQRAIRLTTARLLMEQQRGHLETGGRYRDLLCLMSPALQIEYKRKD
ncbi:MAG: hypothetical protein ABI690_13410 [Chloroflexota bacterium]